MYKVLEIDRDAFLHVGTRRARAHLNSDASLNITNSDTISAFTRSMSLYKQLAY